MTPGRFITLEGGEGAGKSTQARRLAAALGAAGFAVVATREPGGTAGAEEIRALLVAGADDRWSPAAEACLVNAARADHVERLIRPALAAGTWVVCDRFVDSTLAYQGAGKGLGDGVLRSLHHLAAADLWPDLTLVLDLPDGSGLARTRARDGGEGRFEGHDATFHARVAQGFRDLAAAEPRRCRLIDASASEDAVAAQVWAEVSAMARIETALDANPREFAGPDDVRSGHADGVDDGDD